MSAIGAIYSEWQEQKARESKLHEDYAKASKAVQAARSREEQASRALFGCRDRIEKLEKALAALDAEAPTMVQP